MLSGLQGSLIQAAGAAAPLEPADRAAAGRPGTLRRWLAVLTPSLVPALAMLVVGRFRLGNPSLGWDENATWMVAGRTTRQVLHLATNIDGVVAPYYLFMHAWMAVFGDSELALRAPSLLCVAAGVGMAGELGRRLFAPSVGLVGGLLLVATPQLSRYAQDARAYGFEFMFATLATLLLYCAIRHSTWRRWCWYGLSVTLLGLSHMMGLLVLAGHAAVVLTRPLAWPQRTRWLTVTGVAVLPVLPLVALGLSQRDEQLGWIGRLDAAEVLAAPGGVVGSAAVGFLLLGLAMAARWPDRRLAREFAALAVLPPAVLLAVSSATSSMWVPRYVIFVVAPLCLLAAAGLRGRPWRTGLAVLATAVVSVPVHADIRGPASHQGLNFRTAVAIISDRQRPGDGIVFGRVGTWSLRAGFDYQTRGRQAPADLLVQRSAAEVGHLSARECADPVVCIGTTSRVWYLGQRRTGNALEDLGARNADALRDTYRLVSVWPLDRGAVALFERR